MNKVDFPTPFRPDEPDFRAGGQGDGGFVEEAAAPSVEDEVVDLKHGDEPKVKDEERAAKAALPTTTRRRLRGHLPNGSHDPTARMAPLRDTWRAGNEVECNVVARLWFWPACSLPALTAGC